MHSRLGSAVAFALLTTLGLTGCSGGGQERHPVVTAGKGTKDLFLYGEVKRNGKPVKGAKLEVVLMPDADFDDSKVGEKVPMLTAAKATSGSDGSFALRVHADDLPTKFFGTRRHLLNFELNTVAGDDFAIWNSTLWSVGKPRVWRTDAEAAPADSAYRLVLDVGTKQLKATDSFGERSSSEFLVMPTPKGLR